MGEEAAEVGAHHALPPDAVPLVELLRGGRKKPWIDCPRTESNQRPDLSARTDESIGERDGVRAVLMWAAMARQSATSKRSSAREAADVAAACIRAGMSVSSTSAFPSSILFCPAVLDCGLVSWGERYGGASGGNGRRSR